MAEILVYGCQVAAAPQMLQVLHELTGAAVAGSAAPVGRGNWTLEWRTGEVRAEAVFTGEVTESYAGTFMPAQLVEDINPNDGIGGTNASPELLATVGNKLYFTANDGNTRELWVSQGQASNTHSLAIDSLPSEPKNIKVIGDELYFTVERSDKQELWVVNGTETKKLKADINGEIAGDNIINGITDIVSFNGKVYFGATDTDTSGDSRSALWVINGTDINSKNLEIVNDQWNSNYAPSQLTDFGDKLIFLAPGNQGDGRSVWAAEINTSSTTGLSEPYLVSEHSRVRNRGASNLTVIGEQAFFVNFQSFPSSPQLRVTDGEPASLLDPVNSELVLTLPGITSNLTPIGNKLFFTYNSGTGLELWASTVTETEINTSLVKDVNGTSLFNPSNLEVVGNDLFFAADNGNDSSELWIIENVAGTGDLSARTRLVKDINTQPDLGSSVGDLTVVGDKLFFTADDGNGKELWVTEGTESTTQKLKDLDPNIGSIPSDLKVAGNRLVFRASGSSNSQELWVTDATSLETQQLTEDFSPAIDFKIVGDQVYFGSASDSNIGDELWIVDLAGSGSVNTAPTLTGPTNIPIDENTTFVDDLLAGDDTSTEGNGLTYRITGGDDAALFGWENQDSNGDGIDGRLEFISPPDFETRIDQNSDGVYQVEVSAIDGEGLLSDPLAISVTINDVAENTAPVLNVNPTTVNISEAVLQANPTATVLNDAQVEATDDNDQEGNGLTFTLENGDASLFNVDPDGTISFINAPTGSNTYTFDLSVEDLGGLSSSTPITINVTADPIGPNLPPQLEIDDDNTKVYVPENTDINIVIFPTEATDDRDMEGNGLTYEPLGGPDANFFNIDFVTGDIRFNIPPDFENPLDGGGIHAPDNVYDIEITVTDSGGLQDSRSIWIEVEDVVEPDNIPIINSLASFNHPENTTSVTNIDSTDDLDGEGNGITYSISGGIDASAFMINAATGELFFNTLPDYEDPSGQTTYIVDVVATDTAGLTSAPQKITVNIDDIAETIDPTIDGTAQRDVLFGGVNDDTLFGFGGDDDLHGEADNDILYGDGGLDRLWGGDGADRLFGGLDRDALWGGNDDDQLHGDDGDDDLYGEAGNDILRGGAGAVDKLYGGIGNDQLYGEQGHDVLEGDNDDDILDGGDDNDILRGGEGHDHLLGGNGDDALEGGIGNDVLEGGIGLDILDGGDGNDVLKGGGDRDILYGFIGEDHLYGDAGDDDLRGHNDNDRLYGGDGIDRLYGELGDDRLWGGNQNDILFGDDGEDRLDGGAGDDFLNGGQGKDILYGRDGVDEIRGEGENDELYGGTQNDTLWGGNGNDNLYGEDGDDVLWGENDDDILYGGKGNDLLDGGGQNDYLYGGADADTLQGWWGDDHLYGDDGADTLYGHHGVDSLYGGRGNDFLYGEDDNDFLDGGDDNDRLEGWWGDDELHGGNGSDTLFGYHGNDMLDGGNGNDFLYGERDNDILNGGLGDDLLDGGENDDTLNGGLGDDTLDGGVNADTYVFDVDQFGFDQIVNFEAGLDTVDLAYFNGSLSLGALNSNGDSWVDAADNLGSLVNGNLQLAIGGGTIQFNGRTQIAVTDFQGLT